MELTDSFSFLSFLNKGQILMYYRIQGGGGAIYLNIELIRTFG